MSKLDRKDFLVYAITDEKFRSDEEWEFVLKPVFEAGIRILQFRSKSLDGDDFIESGRTISKICHKYGALLIVNDDANFCKLIEADGVHLGQSDMPIETARRMLGDEYIIGATAHNLDEAKKAQASGADYIGAGAAFGSKSKLDAKPIEIAEYRNITGNISIPVVAIGGISLDNMSALADTGIDGVAVISALFDAEDISDAAIRLVAKSRELFE